MQPRDKGGSYELTVIEARDYLHARGTGTHDPATALRFMEDAYAACVARGYDSLLLEQSLDGPSIGAAHIFAVVRERLDAALSLRRIAYVDAKGRDEGRQFVEDVTRNRGVNLRVFESVEKAVAWLAASG